ncbi:aminoglycoside adenylyltransferase family protein [Nocardia brasiliensis]|uniref:aminoglycoside adenylyltransferase family protein n=1 Tax=Nocardia brasiliensis TaxID=37326 RepID=UPI0005A0D8C0|nr:aminoglycoside adenylyltransferase family protein [Nocardia brasiliensis]
MTQEDGVAGLVRRVFGEQLVGVYRHGSAVLGGLRRYSDIDVLVVSADSLDGAQRRVLLEGLLELSGGVGGALRPVELTSVVQGAVRPWRYPPTSDFQYGEWLRAEYEGGEIPSATVSPDLAVLITMVLDGDSTLVGPPPARVLDPVPRADLTHAMVAGVPELVEELGTDTRNVLLTLARVWMTVATGVIAAKDKAADWALDRIAQEHRPVLAHARAVYLGAAEENWTGQAARIERAALTLRAGIEQAATGNETS